MAKGGFERATNHPDYYLSDGSVLFTIQGVLFNVHKSFFERESQVFREIFEEFPLSGSAAHPLRLNDVTPDEFALFLWVWYDRDYARDQRTKEEWITILHLAKRWGFDKIKNLAVRELDSLALPPAERISLYNENGIEGEQLLSSYVELCQSPKVPTEADARLLQMETLINVLQAREGAQRQAGKMGHRSPTSACLEEQALREIVSGVFKMGLSPRSSGTSTGLGDQASYLNGPAPKTPENTSTIIMGDPPVPNKKGYPPLTDSNGKENQEKGSHAESSDKDKTKRTVRGEENKIAKPTQAREDKEKTTQDKGGKGKEKAEPKRPAN